MIFRILKFEYVVLEKVDLLTFLYASLICFSISVDAQQYDVGDSKNLDQEGDNIFKIDSLKKLPIDSLHIWLENNHDSYDREFPEVAHFTLNKDLKLRDFNSVATIHGLISFWNYRNYEVNGPDTIIYHREKQIQIDIKNERWDRVGGGYVDLSVDYFNMNAFKKAQGFLIEAIEILDSVNDEIGLADAYRMLAVSYNETNQPFKALEMCELSLPTLLKDEDYPMISDLYSSGYSDAYLLLKDYENALKYIDMSIAICTENEFAEHIIYLIEVYENKGNIYFEKEDYDLALIFYNKAWQLSLNDSPVKVSENLRIAIGSVLLKQNKYKEALPHLISGVKAAEDLPDLSSDNYLALSECYEKMGQYDAALEFSQKAFKLENRIVQDIIEDIQSESLIKYDSGRKDQMLFEQELIIQRKNLIQWISIGAATLLTFLLSMLYYYFKKNKNKTKLLLTKNIIIQERNQQNELLLKEIHHRVKNNLEIVSSLLALQARQLDDKVAKFAMQESQSRVQSMGIIHQKLYQGDNLSSIEMKDYFVNLGDGILDSFGKNDQVKILCTMNELELDVDAAVPIGLIVNELLTNAMKYAFKNSENPKIQIQLERLADNSLMLEVRDNGIGKSNNQLAKGTGFGSQLIGLLTQQLEGVMNYATENGSHFSFHFKLVSL